MSAKTRRHQQQRQQAASSDADTDVLEPEDNRQELAEPTLEDELAAEHSRLQYLNNDAPDEPEPEPEEDPYAVLQRQFTDLQQQSVRTAAERDAERRRVSELQQVQATAQVNELQAHKLIVDHAIAGTETEVEEAKRAYRAAREVNDVESELEASEALSDAREKLRQLRAGQAEIAQRINNPPQVQQRQAAQADPFEAYLAANHPHPKDQAWLRAHRDDFAGADERHNADTVELAKAGHVLATVRHKLKPGTDEYYAFLDEHMGYVDEGEDEPEPAPKPAPRAAQQRKAPVPSAPPARNGPSAAARSKAATDRATPELKALCDDLGMSVSEYLDNQAAIRASGGEIPGTTRRGKGF